MAATLVKSSADCINLATSVIVTVHHDQQLNNWDCGLSCLKMVLRLITSKYLYVFGHFDHFCIVYFCIQFSKERRKEFSENWLVVLRTEDIATSVWSIDLAYLLRRFGVSHCYYTETLGINPSYAQEAYYKNAINVDHNRVVLKFQDAQHNGVHVEKRQLSLEEILQHLATINPAIVLINDNCIECCTHYAHKIQHKFANIFSNWFQQQFVGHYIVICGYDLHKKIIFYHNPIYSQGICSMDFDTFECARKCHGTDEDIILINKSQNSFPFS